MREPADPVPTVETLAPRQRFLLWAIRVWVGFDRAKALPALPLREAFTAVGVPDGARALDVHCPGCGGLSPDEAALLDAIGAAQHGDDHGARDALLALIPPTHVADTLAAFADLATTLAIGGLLLPDPDADRPAPAAWAAPVQRVTFH